MALRIELRPNEKCIIGGAVIVNTSHGRRIQFDIENKGIMVLREKEIMLPENTDTVCKNIYFTIQMAYIDPENRKNLLEALSSLLKDTAEAAPSLTVTIDQIKKGISEGLYYQALQHTKILIETEKKLLVEATTGGNNVS